MIEGRTDDVARGVYALLGQGTPAQAIIEQALMPGMQEVGACFEDGIFFIPEMMKAARAMQNAMDILEPMLTGSGCSTICNMWHRSQNAWRFSWHPRQVLSNTGHNSGGPLGV